MKTTMFIITTLFFTAAAFADQGQGHGQGQRNDQSVRALSFDDLRVACQNPAKFHNQVAPTNIQVSCKDVHYKWISDKEGSIPMLTARQITTSVYSDKYTVSPTSAALKSDPQSVACAQFKQVAEVVETIRAVSCDELIAYRGTAADFCAGTCDALKDANKEAISVTPTGKYFTLCGSNQGQRDQR